MAALLRDRAREVYRRAVAVTGARRTVGRRVMDDLERDMMRRAREFEATREARMHDTYRRAPISTDEANALLSLWGSHQRSGALIRLWGNVAEIDRPAMLAEWWPQLDFTWAYRSDLLGMFVECGWIGTEARPTDPVVLYRGVAVRSHRRGLSWTTNEKMAANFAAAYRNARSAGTLEGYVFTATVPPDAIVAHLTDRREDEYVVNYSLMPRVRLLRTIQIERD